jgi:nitrogenase subunit NifH
MQESPAVTGARNSEKVPKCATDKTNKTPGAICADSADSLAWHALLDRYRAVEARACDDADCDLAGDLVVQLLAMPAPDSAALQWKLDWFLVDQGGTTASYATGYVAQTVADYRRILGA